MSFLKKLLDSWQVGPNQRLINIKKKIREEVSSLHQLDKISKEKLALLDGRQLKISILKRKNTQLKKIISKLLSLENNDEKLQLRKLLKSAILINPRDRSTIKKHLQSAYRGLKLIGSEINQLNALVEEERNILDRTKEGVLNLSQLKKDLNKINLSQQEISAKIETTLKEIDNKLNINLLTNMFGGETEFKCPHCNTNFVTIEKVQVKANPRIHAHTFYCHFCDHTEEVTDEKLREVQNKWS
jgi:hypothetical protein